MCLDGVQAVQTLSRLNRTSPGKEAPFVLDFVNQAEDIYMAFKPYYNATTLQEPSDPAHLEKLKHELNALHVYLWSEVVGFCHIFYLPQYKQNPSDHARMEKMIQPAVDRFKLLDEEGKAEDEQKPLSEIIDALNKQFGTDFSEEDRLFFEQIKEKPQKMNASFRPRKQIISISLNWESRGSLNLS